MTFKAPAKGEVIEPLFPEHCVVTAPPAVRERADALLFNGEIDCGSLGLIGHPIRFANLHRRQVLVSADLGGRAFTAVHGEGALVLPAERTVGEALRRHFFLGVRAVLGSTIALIGLLAAALLSRHPLVLFAFAGGFALSLGTGMREDVTTLIALLAIGHSVVAGRGGRAASIAGLATGAMLGAAVSLPAEHMLVAGIGLTLGASALAVPAALTRWGLGARRPGSEAPTCSADPRAAPALRTAR